MSKKLVAVQKEETVVEGQKAFRMEVDLPEDKKLLVLVLTSDDLSSSDLLKIKKGQQLALGDRVKVVLFCKGLDEDIDLYVEEA
jgi:hypothetical protein